MYTTANYLLAKYATAWDTLYCIRSGVKTPLVNGQNNEVKLHLQTLIPIYTLTALSLTNALAPTVLYMHTVIFSRLLRTLMHKHKACKIIDITQLEYPYCLVF
jgi:hypothetical protein